jgi:hypothetical protein
MGAGYGLHGAFIKVRFGFFMHVAQKLFDWFGKVAVGFKFGPLTLAKLLKLNPWQANDLPLLQPLHRCCQHHAGHVQGIASIPDSLQVIASLGVQKRILSLANDLDLAGQVHDQDLEPADEMRAMGRSTSIRRRG